MTRTSLRSTFTASLIVLMGFALTPGCKQDEPRKPKSKTMEGVITRVDADKGRLAMKLRNPKNKSEFLPKEIEGSVTPTTEIQINGKLAKLADLREKDTVEATGYRQGKGDEEKIVAEKITVDRPIEVAAPVKPLTPPTPAPTNPAPVAASTPPPATQAAETPPVDPNAATPNAPAPKVGLSPTDALKMFVEEVKKHRNKAAAERAELLKEGRPADDPEVLKRDAIMAKADQAIAQVEDEAAKKGILLQQAAAASQPAGSAPANP